MSRWLRKRVKKAARWLLLICVLPCAVVFDCSFMMLTSVLESHPGLCRFLAAGTAAASVVNFMRAARYIWHAARSSSSSNSHSNSSSVHDIAHAMSSVSFSACTEVSHSLLVENSLPSTFALLSCVCNAILDILLCAVLITVKTVLFAMQWPKVALICFFLMMLL